MRKIFLIHPRQTGKTDKAIYEYLKDPENTIFVCCNSEMKNYVCNRIGIPPKNKYITYDENFLSFTKGRRIKNLILDEYMFFKNKEKIYEVVHYLSPENIYVFSTSNKMYDNEIFEFVKKEKQENWSIKSILDSYKKTKYKFYEDWEKAEEEIIDLCYNFITDPDTILIDRGFSNQVKNTEGYKYMTSSKNFEVEIKNQYTNKETDFPGDSKNVNTDYFPYNI